MRSWIAICAVAVIAARASAQDAPPSDLPAPPTTPAPSPTTTPAPSPAPSADDSSDDYRDVFAGSGASEIEASTDTGTPVVGTGRVGAYVDSDRTTILRTFGTIAKTWGEWTLNSSIAVDAVTSASVDVRTSPALSAVDVMTSASGRTSTSGGQMTDTRYQGTLGSGWKDGSGHAANVTTALATENDYASMSGGVNGSIDVLDRTTTLLGGFTLTDNWISSILDPELHHKMLAIAWSAGIARVLTPSDALRLRYDGRLANGYQASPYRNVRFGDWTTTTNGYGQVLFMNTVGSAGGLPERLPEERLSHALTLEWVHSLAAGVGLHPSVRVGRDDWGVDSLTPAIDLRIARPGWRVQLGYRFYAQTHASFFESKYKDDPSMYSFYTSDKELGRQLGHAGELEYTTQIGDPQGPNDTRLMWFVHADVFRYSYPGFLLLSSRVSGFLETGLTWEL